MMLDEFMGLSECVVFAPSPTLPQQSLRSFSGEGEIGSSPCDRQGVGGGWEGGQFNASRILASTLSMSFRTSSLLKRMTR